MLADLLPWAAVILIGLVQLLREKSYRDAKQAQLDAKDAQIAAKEEQAAALRERLQLHERFSLPQVDEYFASQQRILQGQLDQVRQQAESAEASFRAALEERDRELERAQADGKASIAELEAMRAERDAMLGHLSVIGGQLSDLARLEVSVRDLSMHQMLDRHDADVKIRTFSDRAIELLAQIRAIREAGPEAKCVYCSRPLAAKADEVLEELQSQWRSALGEERWWRERREQLEEEARRERSLGGM